MVLTHGVMLKFICIGCSISLLMDSIQSNPSQLGKESRLSLRLDVLYKFPYGEGPS